VFGVNRPGRDSHLADLADMRAAFADDAARLLSAENQGLARPRGVPMVPVVGCEPSRRTTCNITQLSGLPEPKSISI
jgi:hypothetical protein